MTESPTSREREEMIQRRAYEIWEQEGRPEFRAEEHRRLAEAEMAEIEPARNQEEGNKKSARAIDQSRSEFSRQTGGGVLTGAARDALVGPEGAELRRAELEEKSRSHGDDPRIYPSSSHEMGKVA